MQSSLQGGRSFEKTLTQYKKLGQKWGWVLFREWALFCETMIYISHTSPTENRHCKDSNLALGCFAMMMFWLSSCGTMHLTLLSSSRSVYLNGTQCITFVALFPGHSQVLSRNCIAKSGEGLVPLLHPQTRNGGLDFVIMATCPCSMRLVQAIEQ